MDHSSPHPEPTPAATSAPPDPAGLLVARGPRAAEAVLLERLDRVLPRAPRAADLSRPVRVIVPSRSLRDHLAARLTARHGAVVGLRVQTLFAAAREIVENRGAAPPAPGAAGDLAFEILVRRLARQEAELSRGLDFLLDGYGGVAATVRDLLDAGLDPLYADAAEEALAAALEGDPPVPTTPAEVRRARALVRVAARVGEAMNENGVARRAALVVQATDLLTADPEAALPSRAVFIHGFADATGLVAELVEALLRHADARLVLDTPPDPATAAEDAGSVEDAFAHRFRERLAGVSGESTAEPAAGAPEAALLERFRAPGADAESHQVAIRVRALLDAGVTPEAVGVVARDLEPHRVALRRHLDALGVPFSGVGAAGSPTAAGRRVRGLLDLLTRGADLPADRWLDAVAALPLVTGGEGAAGGLRWRQGPFVDLRLAFYAVGAARLRDVATLDVDRLLQGRGSLPLPARQGLSYGPADDASADGDRESAPDDDELRGESDGELDTELDERQRDPAGRRRAVARRRQVPRAALAGAVHAAAALLRRLESWPHGAAVPVHLARLRRLLTRDLRWRPRSDAHRSLFETLESLESGLPAALDLDRAELRLLLTRALDGEGVTPFGGKGGGVQVLTVTEARGRTFEHLFAVGVNRGVFPRSVRPDPLLPDELRDVLEAVLPDVPRKKRGFDEDRYLFAQLADAAPRVTVSWRTLDDDGQPLSPSPLVERLPGEPAADAPTAPAVYSPHRTPPPPGALPRPARDEAILASLAGAPRSAVEPLLVCAVAEGRSALLAPRLPIEARDLAAARRAVLDEMDPDAGRVRRLGPYFGFLGAVRPGADDPRRSDPWITHLENLAACPWQLFLRRILRLEPTPDPLTALPGLDALLLGNVVHRVLEAVVETAGARPPAAAESLEESKEAIPVAVAWPEQGELDELLTATSRQVLADEGMLLPGLARALARRAGPFLERARELDWSAGPPAAVAAEALGEVVVRDAAGRPRRLRFRADRVDRPDAADAVAASAGLRLTDYKTGKPLSTAKQPATRHRHHLAKLARGLSLQATAYARAAGQGGEGRYLHLRPDAEPEAAVAAVPVDDAAFQAAFEAAAATALAAWDAGAFFPRFEMTQRGAKNPRCDWCEFSQACLRQDSGFRGRLRRWLDEGEDQAGPQAEAEDALRALWNLDAATGTDGEGDR